MLDNLRRSLVTPALMVLLALGLSVLPGGPLLWLGFALLTLAFPIVTHLAEAVVITVGGLRIGGRFGWFLSDLQTILCQILLSLVFLPRIKPI